MGVRVRFWLVILLLQVRSHGQLLHRIVVVDDITIAILVVSLGYDSADTHLDPTILLTV